MFKGEPVDFVRFLSLECGKVTNFVTELCRLFFLSKTYIDNIIWQKN